MAKREKKKLITLFAWFICDVIWPCIILKDCPVKTYKKCKCILFTVPLWPLGILISKYLILYQRGYRNNISQIYVFQCHCSYISSREKALLHTWGRKKNLCVLKQHRGYLGHRRKLLLSWLECLVRLKRIKSLKINELFKRQWIRVCWPIVHRFNPSKDC